MYQITVQKHTVGHKVLLSDLSLEIKPGKVFAILGPNGAGKSTLLKLLSGEAKVKKGRVVLNQLPIEKIPPAQLAGMRAVLPQHSQVAFPYTALEVVKMGGFSWKMSQGDLTVKARKIMQDLEVDHLKDRVITTLSGGEQQRVQLARVALQISQPSETDKFLLLDEPSSSLDMACQHLIFGFVKELTQQQIGVIVIVHDLNIALQYADEAALLMKGKLLTLGTTEEVLTQKNIEKAYQHPVRVVYDPEGYRSPIILSEPKPVKATSTEREKAVFKD
ncbi:heme ABC transporter ATP-binding protein [Rapidithrix thailandica]|uniref:Heme ABC transporter ATP-binding protein n=1 Tax=Rapidithrix thailandica TaxID=413964 RepID=A0AAW9RYC6_9BACT